MNELVRRFTYSSKKLARQMYDQYRHCSRAEFEDLEATGLCALCISLEKYKGKSCMTGCFIIWNNRICVIKTIFRKSKRAEYLRGGNPLPRNNCFADY